MAVFGKLVFKNGKLAFEKIVKKIYNIQNPNQGIKYDTF